MVYQRPSNLVLTVIAALVAAGILLLQINSIPLAPWLALPMVFVLPGYALSLALFAKNTLGGVERALLSVGLSIAVVIIGGFFLNLTPWGLQPFTWLVLLVGITVLVGLVGLLNRRAPVWMARRTLRLEIPGRAVLVFAAALVLLLLALRVAQLPSPANVVEGYTALWLVPSNPTNPDVVELGLSSAELETVSYQLKLQVNGQTIQEWNPITLAPGKPWQQTYVLPSSKGAPQQVRALLYRLDSPGALYRNVLLQRNSPTSDSR